MTSVTAGATLEHTRLFSPLRVGTMDLRSRVMLPPHASAIGNIWGTEEEADAARRLDLATRQAWFLAEQIVTAPAGRDTHKEN